MTRVARTRPGLPKRRRHIAVAVGLVALWMQALAFAAPMPGMAPGAGGDAFMAAALCLDGSPAGDPAPDGKAPAAGKFTTQCTLCQTLQILGSAPTPRNVDVPYRVAPRAQPAWPAIDHRIPADPIATGFLSRAPPTV